MTCVVGVVHKTQVWLGGDAAGVSGDGIFLIQQPKVFLRENFAIAYTTSFRMGQILQYSFYPPEQNSKVGVLEHLATDFMVSLRKTYQ